jgi:hypothetical protein
MFVVDGHVFRALRLTPVKSGKNNIRGSFLLARASASAGPYPYISIGRF